jgi:predicted dehydrogenase
LAINNDQLSAISKQLKANSQSLLLVGFNRRFAPLAQSLKSQLSGLKSPLYAHYRTNAGYLPPDHWTQDPAVGGGRIIGEACHFIDFITFLVGEAPISVTAHALPDAGRYREDNVSMTFTFPDGSIGVVDYLANGDKSFPKERLEVFCGGTVAVLDDFVSLQVTKDGKSTEERGAQDKGWLNEWKALVKAIREGSGPPIPYEQLVGVTRSTFAAVESLRGGNKVTI